MLNPNFTAASPEVLVLCGCQIREMNAALTVPPKREYAKCSCPALFRATKTDPTAYFVRLQKPVSVERI